MKRKEFIKNSLLIGGGIPLVGCLPSSDPSPKSSQDDRHVDSWNSGEVAHILPTVNHNRILVSTSFYRTLRRPHLTLGTRTIEGQMRDSQGYFWVFDVMDLEPSTLYDLRLYEDSEPLCDPWPLRTFPDPESDAGQMNVMVFTCAGGHPSVQEFLPIPSAEREPPTHFAEKRRRLLRRGLRFQPDALVAIGDHVYWDLSGNGNTRYGTDDDQRAIALAGKFNKNLPVLGSMNEDVLKKAVTPQIIDLYGTACRSTPVFFFNDDHDYFENDEANEHLITFPPKPFQLELGRAVQRMYYPEFLPDVNRPLNLPGSSASDRVKSSSESFGTVRFGKLAELLLYDCRRFVTLDGDKAQFIPKEAERWLHTRTQSKDVKHTIHIPSTPYGWSAGKWLEWYPDILGPDRRLRADLPKYAWQTGWLHQHDRILQKLHDTTFKSPFVISGDLHAFGSGRIVRNGQTSFESNPVNMFLAGPLASIVYPSTFRKTKAKNPAAIGMEEDFEIKEENGFSILTIDRSSINVKMFNYLWTRDSLYEIPELQPFQDLKV